MKSLKKGLTPIQISRRTRYILWRQACNNGVIHPRKSGSGRSKGQFSTRYGEKPVGTKVIRMFLARTATMMGSRSNNIPKVV